MPSYSAHERTQRLQTTYSVTGTTLAPVHIGDGNVLNRDVEFVSDGKNIHVINAIAAFDKKSREGVALPDFDTGFRLSSVLDESEYAEYAREFGYSLDLEHHPQYLRASIKTPDHKLYVPGSSLKGALRTAFMNGIILHKKNLRKPPDLQQWFKDLVEPITFPHPKKRKEVPRNNPAEYMERRVFRADTERDAEGREHPAIHKDLLRHIVVRDSSAHPISGIKVELYSAKSGELERLSSKLDLTYEALAANTTFATELVWQQRQLDLPKFMSRTPEQKDLANWLRENSEVMKFDPFLSYCRAGVEELLEQELNFYTEFDKVSKLVPVRRFYESLQAKCKTLV